MPTMPLIEIGALSKSLSGYQNLQDTQLDLQDGEINALMGGNATDKSTNMKILWGTLLQDKGSISFNGALIVVDGSETACNYGLDIVHQELKLINHPTVAQNFLIGWERRGRGRLVLDEAMMNAATATQAAEIATARSLALKVLRCIIARLKPVNFTEKNI